MPLPLIPIGAALAAGGSLVPHAAGGLIVTSAATGYVAGTYLSTAAIGWLIAIASTTLGAGALYLSGAAASIVGSAGIFGTTIGVSGITGALMSVGIISFTPIWVPVAVVTRHSWPPCVGLRDKIANPTYSKRSPDVIREPLLRHPRIDIRATLLNTIQIS